MNAYAYEYPSCFQIIVTDGTESGTFDYSFGKDQDVEVSVTESIRLAEAATQTVTPSPVVI